MYASDVIREVRRIVSNRPLTQYMDPVCKYTKGKCSDGSRGCLIGQAIISAYPELEAKIVEIDSIKQMGASAILNELKINGSTVEKLWIDIVQNGQDDCEIWQDCVAYADENYPL